MLKRKSVSIFNEVNICCLGKFTLFELINRAGARALHKANVDYPRLVYVVETYNRPKFPKHEFARVPVFLHSCRWYQLHQNVIMCLRTQSLIPKVICRTSCDICCDQYAVCITVNKLNVLMIEIEV